MTEVKCVVTGDATVGKRSLLHTYLTRSFPTSIYRPFSHGIDDMTVTIQVGRRSTNLRLDRVAAGQDYEKLRPLTYVDCNVFLLFFSLVDPDTLKNCWTLWYPELKHFSPGVPIILVGTKKDLRDEAAKDSVPFSKGLKMSEKIKAVRYLECSSFTGENLDEVFQEAAKVGLEQTNQKKKRKKSASSCSIS